jgi:hypothetical protein
MGFGESDDPVVDGWFLYKRTQKIVHNVAGNSSGKNAAKDC